MRQNLTKQVIEEMVKSGKNNFFESDRPFREKKLLNEINPYIYFNERLKVTWGRAWICNMYHEERHIIGIPKDFPHINVEGRKGRFVLEMNPACQYAPIYEVYDTVFHEMAHLLDFRLNGYYIRYKEDHHRGWKDIHLAMGGNGESYGPQNIDLSQFRITSNRCHWRS